MSEESIDQASRSRLGALLVRLGEGIRRVTWEQAERDAARLAARLVDAVPDLAAARFEAIPRGGLFVLGMLAYLLDLSEERIGPASDLGEPLVLVDDCALSGLRSRQALERSGSTRVVLAHLYSPTPVRDALSRDPRVVACVAARDLADRTREILPDAEARRAAEERWRDRLGVRPWYGLAEPLAFPWNEPDRPFWNQVTGRAEDGWRLVPPDRNLKARGRLGDAELLGPAVDAAAGWRLADGVAWGEFDGVIWLCRLADREIFSLDGVAAELWRGLAVGGDEVTVASRAAASYAVDRRTVQGDLVALLDELASAGLMEFREDSGDAE